MVDFQVMRTTKTALVAVIVAILTAACATGGSLYTFDNNGLESVPPTEIGGEPAPAATPGVEVSGREVLRLEQRPGAGRLLWTVDRLPARSEFILGFDFAASGATEVAVIVHADDAEPIRFTVLHDEASVSDASGARAGGDGGDDTLEFRRFVSEPFTVLGNTIDVELVIDAVSDTRLLLDDFFVKETPF